jgi:hypothetical protein
MTAAGRRRLTADILVTADHGVGEKTSDDEEDEGEDEGEDEEGRPKT